MIKKISIVILLFLIIALTGCGTQKDESQDNSDSAAEYDIAVFAMDTVMSLKAYGDNSEEALQAAENEILRLDKLLSTGNEESEIYGINQKGSGTLSEDSLYLLETSLEINSDYCGAFNPLMYPLMKAWGFTDKNYRVPDQDELSELLKLTDVNNIVLDDSTGELSFKMEGMQLDFGGIAKGYTSERVIDILKSYGIESAVISLGGNVQALGTKVNGEPWNVAIYDPLNDSSYLGMLKITDKCVITSGAYERNFTENGVLYHHIIDPETGYPANNGIISSTVVSDDGTLADGLSTTFYILGLEKSIELWKENSDKFDIILMTDNGELYVSEGISEDFTSAYKVNIIKKE